jgi:hypothetical protein
MSPSRETAIFAQDLYEWLLIAGIQTDPPEERRKSLARAFEAWPKLCRRMAALEALAPNEAEDGYRYDETLQTLIRKAA